MSNIEKVENKKPIEKFRDSLLGEKSKLEKVLPAHISFEKFHSVVVTACISNPALLSANRHSLLLSCIKAATDGLLPDQREAALVIFKAKVKDESGKDQWIEKVQYLPMYAGLLKKARQSREISSIKTHVVYEKDEFKYLLGDEDRITHEPYMGSDDRGEIIAAYCIANLKDGSVYREVMSRADIEKVRKSSKAGSISESDLKYNPGSKIGDPKGIWAAWYEEMARKTVFRRAAKWLPQSIDKEGNEIKIFENDESIDAFDGITEAPPEVIDVIEHDADGVVQETPAQPDLKKKIEQKKEKASAPDPITKEELENLRATPFDLEQAIRKALAEAKTKDEALLIVSETHAESLAIIKEKAAGSYQTLKGFIDKRIEALPE